MKQFGDLVYKMNICVAATVFLFLPFAFEEGTPFMKVWDKSFLPSFLLINVSSCTYFIFSVIKVYDIIDPKYENYWNNIFNCIFFFRYFIVCTLNVQLKFQFLPTHQAVVWQMWVPLILMTSIKLRILLSLSLVPCIL